MAATRVQTNTNSGSATTVVVSFTSTTTSGGTIVVGVITGFTSFSALTGVTDNKSNTYTQVGTGVTVGNGTLYVYTATNITGGASHTVTAAFSGSGQNNAVMARNYTGLATTSVVDQTGTGSGSGTAITATAAGATSQANELSVIFVGSQNTGLTLSGTGYGNAATVSGGQGLESVDGDLTTISTPSFSGTLSGFSSWVSRIVTLKESGGGATVTHNFMTMGMGS